LSDAETTEGTRLQNTIHYIPAQVVACVSPYDYTVVMPLRMLPLT